MKSNEHISINGKAAFYASIYEDLRKAALNCGWALGLHGSLSSDMDIMAMPWTEDAKPVEEMIRALSDCFTDNPFKDRHTIPYHEKPNGRVVYSMPIWADFYLDINIISGATVEATRSMIVEAEKEKEIERLKEENGRLKDDDLWQGEIEGLNRVISKMFADKINIARISAKEIEQLTAERDAYKKLFDSVKKWEWALDGRKFNGNYKEVLMQIFEVLNQFNNT